MTLNTTCRWITVAVLACVCVPVFAVGYFVDQNHPAADDAGAGTPERPFKTISRATRSLAAGDRVLVRTGIYR